MVSESPDLQRELDDLMGDAAGRAALHRRAATAVFAEDRALVLFGAGGLGRRTLARLRAQGREPVAFGDNAPALWGTQVDGLGVLSPDEVAEVWGTSAVVVVTIWRAEGGHSYVATRAQLRALGCERVVPFLSLYVAHSQTYLPYLAAGDPEGVASASARVAVAFTLLDDRESRRQFIDQLRWRLDGDFDAVRDPSPGCDAENEYWPRGLVSIGRSEVVIDCGAFDGDTLARFASAFDGFAAWLAFEPDPLSFAGLRRRLEGLPPDLSERVRPSAAATGDTAGIAWFSAVGTAASNLSEAGSGAAIEVPVVSLDQLDLPLPVTFLKLDVEGAEAATLRGARGLLRRDQPFLAVSCYHRQADLWELPILLHELLPDHRLALRAHAAEAFDLVLYGIPKTRRGAPWEEGT